jgi:hypothetical protein
MREKFGTNDPNFSFFEISLHSLHGRMSSSKAHLEKSPNQKKTK